MGLTTIKTFDSSIEANLAKTKLENAGIQCVLFDENMGSLDPYSIAVGGIRLNVLAEDIEKALAVLAFNEK
ncbi:hypothetical protein FUAX_06910 [Fulvitalea axinellae]|uniref:DUF2007 domain-containing protein n=1 Tax=Fulvitalea axinellae TaxID=1182444 RepID=A0AAU9CPG4_9BACT|nr:hypothetical protein FUAX_06910 [Fulvitalea axinellae]